MKIKVIEEVRVGVIRDWNINNVQEIQITKEGKSGLPVGKQLVIFYHEDEAPEPSVHSLANKQGCTVVIR